MEPVSLTAQWTAAIRAQEHNRGEDALFRDEFAHELALPDGFRLLERYSAGGVHDFVSIRTKYFDEAGVRIAQKYQDVRQIVIVASGMDTRAFRLQWPSDVVVYELDHSALIEEKNKRLDTLKAIPSVQRVAISADLSGDWSPLLINGGFDPNKSTLWLIEGLLFFLTEIQVKKLLNTCHSLCSGGSYLVTDMTSSTLLQSPLSKPFLHLLDTDGVPWKFGTDEPEAFLSEHGWSALEVKEPGMPGAGEGRWPYKPMPRNISGVARNWLITAGKN